MAGDLTTLTNTRIGEAIMKDNYLEIRRLVDTTEENFGLRDQRDNTYLHLLCTTYRPYVFYALIQHPKIDLNATNKHGNTPLHVTAQEKETCHVTDLLLAGADCTLRNKYGKTAYEMGKENSHWISQYKRLQPGMRLSFKTCDLNTVQYFINCWSLTDNVIHGRTARQEALYCNRKDIVVLLEKHKFTLRAIHAVLTGNHKTLKYVTTRTTANVNLMQQISGCRPVHVLQHTFRMGDVEAALLLLQGGASLNLPVHINHYIKGPLYFEMLNRTSKFQLDDIKKLLTNGADLSLRDERGRTSLMYVIDNYTGEKSAALGEYLLAMGVDAAARDETGCTAREIAMLARRRDMVHVIDEHIVDLIKSSDTAKLRHLLLKMYEHVFFEFRYRDTFLISLGNESKAVARMLRSWTKKQMFIQAFHHLIPDGLHHDLVNVVQYVDDKALLMCSQDKGGRSTAMLAALHRRKDFLQWTTENLTDLGTDCTDNHGRTILHYLYGAGLPELVEPFVLLGASANTLDLSGNKPGDYQDNRKLRRLLFLQKKVRYGMEQELHCLHHYEKLLRIIRSKERTTKDFTAVLKELKCPVSDIATILCASRTPAIPRYRDLLLCAIDHQKPDIAKRLIFLKVDPTVREKYELEDGTERWMNASERAAYTGQDDVTEYMKEREACERKLEREKQEYRHVREELQGRLSNENDNDESVKDRNTEEDVNSSSESCSESEYSYEYDEYYDNDDSSCSGADCSDDEGGQPARCHTSMSTREELQISRPVTR